MNRIAPTFLFLVLPACFAPGQQPAGTPGPWTSADAALNLLAGHQLIPEDAALKGAILEALVRAVDPGGEVLSQEEAAKRERAERGILPNCGWRLSATNHYVRFLEPIESASNPGVQLGWVITAFGEEPADTHSWSSALQRLRGGPAEGLPVRLTSPDGSLSTNMTLRLPSTSESPVATREIWMADILYVRLNGLYDRAGASIREALTPPKGARGILLDLRDAGGGDQETAISLASVFCETDKPMARWSDPGGKNLTEIKPVTGSTKHTGLPVLVLVNHGTRDASELLAALMSKAGRSVITIGEATRGNPMLRESLPFEGRVLRVATRKLLFNDGTSLDALITLKPDLPVPDRDVSDPSAAEDAGFSQNPLRTGDTQEHMAQMEVFLRIQHDGILKRAMDVMLGLRVLPAGRLAP